MMNILISDPTLRDGNHAVRHQLSVDNLVKYCKAADKAGIPIVEVGHGNGLGGSSLLVGESAVSDEDVLKICRDNLKTSKLGVHVIPGFSTIRQNLISAIDLGVDVFRVASHCTEADITKKHIEYLRNSDKTVYGVLMMSHMAPVNVLVQEALKMESYGAEGIIIMDSAGHYLPIDVNERIRLLVDCLNIPVGFHGHNNLGMAVANSISAVNAGAKILDGTTRGFGAGAGNTQLEVLVAVLHKLGYNTNIDLYKLLDTTKIVEEFNPIPQNISPLSIVSGLAGVFSGFVKKVESASSQFGVDSRDIIFELGRRNAVAGQESLIIEVAQDLASIKSKEEYHGF